MSFTHARAWLGALLALACLLSAHPAKAQNSVNINSYMLTPSSLTSSGGNVDVLSNVTSDYGVDTVTVLIRDSNGVLLNSVDAGHQAGTDNYDATIGVPYNITTSTEVFIINIEATDLAGFFDERQTNIHVAPAAVALTVSGVSVSPTSVVGGNSSTGTVTVSEAAPLYGLTVTLSSNNAAATVPAMVTIPAGATSYPFTITTSAVTSAQTVTLTASANGSTNTASLAVTPANAGVPTITGFTPTSGPVGTSVTITGTNLTGASVLGFQGAHATSFTVNGAGTQITTTVPSGAQTGPIAVKTPGGTARSSASFTVTATAQKPTITGYTPTSGPIGTVVTITGTNFLGATIVGFQGAHAKTFTVNSATQITATVPSGAVTGPIAVLTPGGEAKSANYFVVVAAPTITGFSPTSGPVGTTVIITGTNLGGTTVVGFQGKHATSFTVNGAGTQITTTVPSGAQTGPIAVATPSGTAHSSTSFTVTP